jgi:imidazoleglycerol-phosphate dehydratase
MRCAPAGSSARPAETDILVEVNLDGTGKYDVATGIGFLDHMVEQFSRHSLIDVTLKVRATCTSTSTTPPRTARSRSARRSARRWATRPASAATAQAYSPMDETLARVALDISGRPVPGVEGRFTQEKLGEWDTELIEHWFHSVAQAAGSRCTSSCSTAEQPPHLRSLFKGFARAMRAGGGARSAQGRGDARAPRGSSVAEAIAR